MAKRNIFRSVAAVLALGMCMTGLAGFGRFYLGQKMTD